MKGNIPLAGLLKRNLCESGGPEPPGGGAPHNDKQEYRECRKT